MSITVPQQAHSKSATPSMELSKLPTTADLEQQTATDEPLRLKGEPRPLVSAKAQKLMKVASRRLRLLMRKLWLQDWSFHLRDGRQWYTGLPGVCHHVSDQLSSGRRLVRRPLSPPYALCDQYAPFYSGVLDCLTCGCCSCTSGCGSRHT